MIFYLSVIFLGMTVAFLLNFFVFLPTPIPNIDLRANCLIGVVVSTILVIAIDGGIAAIFHALQEKHINENWKYFRVSKKEKRVLEFFGTKKFKKFLPDLGVLAKFAKGKIAEPTNLDYINMYTKESCSGELGHVIMLFAGFLIIFIFPLQYFYCFGLPIGIVNFLLNLLPIMSLRYNRFKLVKMKNALEAKEKSKQMKESV